MSNISLLDEIDNAVIDSKFAVMESMIEVYSKAYSIVENYDGDILPGFEIFSESYVLEADTEQTEEKTDEERFGKGGTRFRRVKKDGTKESLAWSIFTFLGRVVGLCVDVCKQLLKNKKVANAETNAATLEEQIKNMDEEEREAYYRAINAELENAEIGQDAQGNVFIRGVKKGFAWLGDHKLMIGLFTAATALFTFISTYFSKNISVNDLDKKVDQARNMANKIKNVDNEEDAAKLAKDAIGTAAANSNANAKEKANSKEDQVKKGVSLKSIGKNIKEWISNLRSVEDSADNAIAAVNSLEDREDIKTNKKLNSKLKDLTSSISKVVDKVRRECSDILNVSSIIEFGANKAKSFGSGVKNVASNVKNKFTKGSPKPDNGPNESTDNGDGTSEMN